MGTNSQAMPWDCTGSFGKRAFNAGPGQAHLCQWPLKMRLVSSVSPYFHRTHLILSADCAAYSYKNFHSSLLGGRVLIIGCPETDGGGFTDKLAEILRLNDILSIAVVRMDAPCCRSLTDAVTEAVQRSKKDIPIRLTTVFAEGEVIE